MAEEYKNHTDVFHYNDKTGMYKSLAINPTDKNDCAFFSIREGMKGQKANSLSLRLSKSEIAYIIMDLTKLYNKLD
jgi:hypothetical protein